MKRKLWPLILSALAVTVLVFWAVTRTPRNLPRQRLPDGSIVTIKQVSYGKSVTIPAGTPWEQIAGRILPDVIAKRLGLRTTTFTNATETTFLIVETFRTNRIFSAYPRAMPFSLFTHIVMADDVGNELQLIRVLQTRRGSNSLVEVFATPLVSHLATQLKLQLTQRDYASAANPTSASAAFVVPNPAPRSQPRWKPGPLPMTNRLHKLTIVLSAIPRAPPVSPSMASAASSPTTLSGLHIFENDAPSTNWMVLGFSVQDEEGNVSEFPGRFSPREPRIFRFTLTRKSPSSLDDVLTFRDVAVSDSPNQPFVAITTNFHTSTVRIERFSRGQLEYGITPRITNLSHHLTVEYAYENGRRHIELNNFGYSYSGANIGFSTSNPDPIKSADITFLFTTNLFVEFLATPEPESSDAPTAK